MAKFSLARVPYYCSVAVFMVFVALISFINNTTSTGIASDFHLAIIAISLGLTGLSVFYAFRARSGDDDDADAEIAGLPFGKLYYYYAVLAVAAWRAISGYLSNHNATGIESTYGIIWIFAAVAIALFTWANYRTYTAKMVPPPRVD